MKPPSIPLFKGGGDQKHSNFPKKKDGRNIYLGINTLCKLSDELSCQKQTA
jgi:hypothetical protein